MLPTILVVLVVLILVPFAYHAMHRGNLSWRLPGWMVPIINPQQPAGAVVVLQQELHRQIERDQIVTLGKSRIAPVGAAVLCHPDDATKARAILPQIKAEAVNHARSCGLAISESFQVQVHDDPNRQPRRPKVTCWIAGEHAPQPPATPQALTAIVPAEPAAPAVSGAGGSTWREVTDTPRIAAEPAAASHDLPTQLLPESDIPTDHRTLPGMLRLIDRHGRELPIKAGAAGQVIGRSEHADLRINHRTISRQHALLLRRGDVYTIEAHESCTNGVWVDSRPAVAGDPIRLAEGSTIVLAPEVIYTVTYKATT